MKKTMKTKKMKKWIVYVILIVLFCFCGIANADSTNLGTMNIHKLANYQEARTPYEISYEDQCRNHWERRADLYPVVVKDFWAGTADWIVVGIGYSVATTAVAAGIVAGGVPGIVGGLGLCIAAPTTRYMLEKPLAEYAVQPSMTYSMVYFNGVKESRNE